MNHLDLFSGIGGFSLAAQRVWGKDHNIVAFVEQDKYCQKVLNKHWPDVPIIENIEDYRYERFEGGPVKTEGFKCGEYQQPSIDLLTGGFPCQPFSVAGKRKGKEDDRFLWHEMLRIIQESKPSWIIGENVTGIIAMELDNCITELECEGYEVQTFIIPACGVDLPHQRERSWILANASSPGLEMLPSKHGIYEKDDGLAPSTLSSYSYVERIYGLPDSEHIRRNYGIPSRVDRLKALGNAIVPQVVMPIMQAIKGIK
jgi:DNA (cytosine-5)-methyltransferase 1